MLAQRYEQKRIEALLQVPQPPVEISDNRKQSKAERAKNKPGRFWARSSAGVYMNAHRRRMNGY